MVLSPAVDESPAQWVVDSLKTFGSNVGGLVPDLFEAYARVFHPAWIGREDGRPVSWGEIAKTNNKTAHPEMQFRALVPPGSFDQAGNMRGCQPDLWTSPPSDGEIPDEIATELAHVLSGFTSTPNECYFAYWEGWGDPSPMVAVKPGPFWRLRHRWAAMKVEQESGSEGTPRASRDAAAHFKTPGRGYHLFRGEIFEVTTAWDGTGGSPPTMWWPADHAWFVHTEIDLDSTFVGASRPCIDALLATSELEALEAEITHGITWGSEKLNDGVRHDPSE